MKWLSGVIDNALYPVLFLDYLKSAIPILANGFPRMIAVLLLAIALTYMNYRGLTIAGRVAIFLGVFSLLPFLFMGLVAIPRLKPSRWFVLDFNNVDWALYLNTLFWNLNYWDSWRGVVEILGPRGFCPIKHGNVCSRDEQLLVPASWNGGTGHAS